MKDGAVSFIIVNRDGGALLRECLDSIAAQTYSDCEIIVVDNGSTDSSCDVLHSCRERCSLVRLGTNRGFAEGNNIGLAETHGEFVALINNDVTIAPDWTEKMVRPLRRDPAVGSVACRIPQKQAPDRLDSAGMDFVACGTVSAGFGIPADHPDLARRRPLGAVASAALYRRKALEAVGLFHPEYFAYYEDTDLSLRLHLYRYECAYVHDAVAVHRGSATGGKGSKFHTYQLRRNIEYLYWVDMIGSLAWRYAVPHLLYECCACLAALRSGRFCATVRAKRDAIRNLRWILNERRRLRATLMSHGMLEMAQDRLRRSMMPWWLPYVRPCSWRRAVCHG